MKTIEKIRYTPVDEAADIINERRQDEELQQRYAEMVGNDIPVGPFVADSASAVFAEYVARPTGTDIAFAEQAIAGGMKPWWLTYESDKFTSSNPKKVSMWRPPLAMPKGQDRRSWIVDRTGARQSIGRAATIYPDLTVGEYWADLRNNVLGKANLDQTIGNVMDIGDWYRRQAKRRGYDGESIAKGYYSAVMGSYAVRAVLFCNFDRYPDFYPTALSGYSEAANELEVEPIIVKFSPDEQPESLDGRRRLNLDQTDVTWLNPEQIENLTTLGTIQGGTE